MVRLVSLVQPRSFLAEIITQADKRNFKYTVGRSLSFFSFFLSFFFFFLLPSPMTKQAETFLKIKLPPLHRALARGEIVFLHGVSCNFITAYKYALMT